MDARVERVAVCTTAAIGAAALVLVYLPALGGEFLNWDDHEWIVANPFVTGERPFADLWTGFVHHTYYPLYASALRLLWAAGGTAWPFHAASLTGFVAAVVLWHRCLLRLGLGAAAAGLGMAWFAFHPLRVESVVWASALRDVLSLDLCLLALLLHLSRGRARFVAPAAFVAAILCKSMVFALAPAPILIDWALRNRPWRVALASAAPFLTVGAAGAVVSYLAYRPVAAVNSYPAADLGHSLPVLAQIQLRYLRLQLWPSDLAALPSAPAGGAIGWGVLVVGAALVAVCVWLAVRGRRGSIALCAMYALPMVPVSGLLPLTFPVADRYSLLPSLAVSFGVAWLAGILLGPRVTAILALLAAVVLAALTVVEIPTWNDSQTLWSRSLARFPAEPVAHQNYASAAGSQGRMDEAVHHLAVALELTDGLEPQTTRLVELSLHAELLRQHVPSSHVDGWLRRYRRAAASPEGLADLAVGLAASRLVAPCELLLRRAEALGDPGATPWLARATYSARGGEWWRTLGYAARGRQTAADDPQLMALQAMALIRLGGPEAARSLAVALAAASPGLDADQVLRELDDRAEP